MNDSHMGKLADSAVAGPVLQRFGALAECRDVAPGAVVARQGDPVAQVLLVCEGRFLLLRRVADRPVPVDAMGRGGLIGLPGVYTGGRHPFTVEATTAGKIGAIPVARFCHVLANDGELALLVLAALSGPLSRTLRGAQDMKLKSARQRLAGYLAGLPGMPEEGPGTVVLPLPKKTLAADLGMTPQSFSRALRQMRALGVESPRDGSVRVRNVALLRDYYEFGEVET